MAPDIAAFSHMLGSLIDVVVDRREAEGKPFVSAAIDVTGILGEYAARLFSSVESDEQRAIMVGLFIKDLPLAVDKMRIAALVSLAEKEGRQ